jgi:hypothetical protein
MGGGGEVKEKLRVFPTPTRQRWPVFPHGTAEGSRWVGGWLGPTAGLNEVAKTEAPASAGNRTPPFQSIAYLLCRQNCGGPARSK